MKFVLKTPLLDSIGSFSGASRVVLFHLDSCYWNIVKYCQHCFQLVICHLEDSQISHFDIVTNQYYFNLVIFLQFRTIFILQFHENWSRDVACCFNCYVEARIRRWMLWILKLLVLRTFFIQVIKTSNINVSNKDNI